MRLFKFSRMLKVFKVLKLASSLNEWDDDPAVKVIKDLRRFTSLLLGVFFTAHYAACAFAYAAQGTTRGWSKSTWVADYFNGGEAVRHGEDEPAVDDHHDDHGHRHYYRAFPAPMELYCVAMYWAFTTLTTVGYGDVLPVSRAEMAVTVVVQFAGTCILGYVMGDVASMLTKEEASSRMIKDRIESINAYMKHRGLPPELKAQIRSHFSYSWQKTSVWDEREILLELPAFMRNEVVLYCNASVLDCVPSVRAMDASELLLMPQATFADVAGEEPVVAARFRVLAERQYAATLDRLRKRSNLTGVKRPKCAEAREATCFPGSGGRASSRARRRRRPLEEAKGDIVRDILAALDRRARDDRVDLERIVAERTLDAVATHGAMERTKAMMRGSKA
ncbi:cyclic nucleotide-gated ion channel [Aureococcus anophagefferens]|nr:cyclic nucleotide-gated ion channel [Aureococcus anophagefferens]